jgi:hypothetical protein
MRPMRPAVVVRALVLRVDAQTRWRPGVGVAVGWADLGICGLMAQFLDDAAAGAWIFDGSRPDLVLRQLLDAE